MATKRKEVGPKCPKCNSRDLTSRGDSHFTDRDGALVMSFRWTCNDCGREFTTNVAGKPKRPRSQPLHVPLPFDAFVSGILKVDPKKLPSKQAAAKKRAALDDNYPLTATITKSGEGGRMLAGGNFWQARLEDGTAVRVHLTGRVKTIRTPTAEVGQVVRVTQPQGDPPRCSVHTSDLQWISPSKRARLAKKGKANRGNQAKG